MIKRTLLSFNITFSVLIFIISTQIAIAGVQVDMGAQDQDVAPGWIEWSEPPQNLQSSLDMGDMGIVHITQADGNNGVDWRDRGDTQWALGDVVEDGVKKYGDGLRLTFSALPAGNYQVTLYAHDQTRDTGPNNQDVYVVDSLHPTEYLAYDDQIRTDENWPTSPTGEPGSCVFSLSSNGMDAVYIKITSSMETWLNGFSLCDGGPAKAENPTPFDNEPYQQTDIVLSWAPAVCAKSYKVYLGTDHDNLTLIADTKNLFFDPNLDANIKYYWRVDSIGDSGTTSGKVWSFDTNFPGQLPKVSDALLEQLGKQRVPDWLRCPRFYTADRTWDLPDGGVANLVDRVADNLGTAFRAGFYHSGYCYYQSDTIPHIAGLEDRDVLREAVDRGKEKGIKILAYMNPDGFALDHPLMAEYAIKKADGSINDFTFFASDRMRLACHNHPGYRQFLANMLTEVFTDYKPDGLYVDGLGARICYCEHCKDKYRAMFSEEMPVKFEDYNPRIPTWPMSDYPELIGDPHDPDSYKLTAFLYQTQVEITKYFYDTVKAAEPNAAVTFHTWPTPLNGQYYDMTLGEIYIAAPWVHTLWKVSEFCSYGAGFPVANLFNPGSDYGTNAEALLEMGQILANGLVPNRWNTKGMVEMYGFMKRNSTYLDTARTDRVKYCGLVRGIVTDYIQQTITDELGFRLLAGPNNKIRIQEREITGFVDTYCFRNDGKSPSDSNYISELGDPNILFIPAEDYNAVDSVTSGANVTWNTVTDSNTLTGSYVVPLGIKPATPETSLIYDVPMLINSREDLQLWARVFFPHGGSDSLYWSLSLDNGSSWLPEQYTVDSSIGWVHEPKWVWLKARVISPVAGDYDHIQAPYVGAYSALLRGQVPVVTLRRNRFTEQLGNFRVLCLANEVALRPDEIDSIRQFVAAGGGLVASYQTSLYDVNCNKLDDFALADLFGVSYENIAYVNEPKQISFLNSHALTEGLEGHVIDYDQPALKVKLTTGSAVGNLEPGGLPAVVVNNYALGRVVYMPVRLDSVQCNNLDADIERLYANAVKWAGGGDAAVEVQADQSVGVTLFDQYDEPGPAARRLVHLLNYSGPTNEYFDHVDNITNVSVSLEVPVARTVTRLHRLWDVNEVDFVVDNRRVNFTLDQIGEYEIVVAEFSDWWDFDNNGLASFSDLAVLVRNWLNDNSVLANCPEEPTGDLNADCKVNFKDIAILISHWLK
jgi:hypothetical protein